MRRTRAARASLTPPPTAIARKRIVIGSRPLRASDCRVATDQARRTGQGCRSSLLPAYLGDLCGSAKRREAGGERRDPMECVMTNQPVRPFVRNFPTMVAETDRIEPAPRRVRGTLNGRTIFDTTRAQYVWEWPNYPQYYVPFEDVTQHFLFDEGRPQKLHLGTAAPPRQGGVSHDVHDPWSRTRSISSVADSRLGIPRPRPRPPAPAPRVRHSYAFSRWTCRRSLLM